MDPRRLISRCQPADLVELLFQSVLWVGIGIVAAANVVFF